jgi:bifunctional DNA-binding transcriptional regulator/antitoxin component of YhaV-PrlF toxin-antitoxin module
MIAKLSVKGQMVIPEAVREQAQVGYGDELEIGCSNGLIVMRKRRALTPAGIRSLLLAGRELPKQSPGDEATVIRTIENIRKGSRA